MKKGVWFGLSIMAAVVVLTIALLPPLSQITQGHLGLLMLSQAHSFSAVIISAALVGMGSAVFHPEASRVAHMAAGKSRGLAQSLFQVGGNAGSSIGPVLAALIIVPHGQSQEETVAEGFRGVGEEGRR